MNFEEQYEKIINDKETVKEFDGTNFSPIPAILAEDYMKDELNDIHDELMGYPEEFKKEPYQMYRRYNAYLNMHFALIENVHPLTSIGMERIERWRRSVDEYEALSGGAIPLIATVTSGSEDIVKSLIPREILELIDNPGRHILAALKYFPSDEEAKSYVDFALKERKAYEKAEETGEEPRIDYTAFKKSRKKGVIKPVGVLSFTLEEDGGTTQADIEWLYVKPEERNHGAANALMAEMLYALKDKNIEAVTMSIDEEQLAADGEPSSFIEPTTELFRKAGIETEDEQEDFEPENEFAPIIHFLTSWKFEGMPVPEENIRTRLSDVNIPGTAKKIAQSGAVEALGKLSDIDFKRTVQGYVNKNPGIYDARLPYAGKERYDTDISCYYKEKGKITGILLARKNYRREIYVDMIQTDVLSVEHFFGMLGFMILSAQKKYSMDTTLIVPVRQEHIVNVFEKLVPELKYRVCVRSALIRPDFDITSEEWEEMREGLKELDDAQIAELTKAAAENALAGG
ncbi:MAG: GNAT family N-acetyltransferase [Lachnospiraceae bacterium]|nr:GNAT family N-acetyltransferase [Lachnospiraceae bacterium]